MNPETTAWLEGTARRVIDAQLTEGARMDTKARELLGFVGIILGLLATAASQSGSVAGVFGAIFYFAAIVAVASLIWAGVHVVQELVLQPPAFHDIGPTAIMGYRRDPALATMKPEEIQAQAFYDLSDAAQENAKLIERAHEHLSAAYGVFAVGLVAAAIAIVALVLSLI